MAIYTVLIAFRFKANICTVRGIGRFGLLLIARKNKFLVFCGAEKLLRNVCFFS